MTLRTKTLTAVAALSLTTAAAWAQSTTITVPVTEPGAAAAPQPTGPGTVVTVDPDGTQNVETIGATEPAAEPAATATDAEPAPDAATEAATGADPAPAEETEPADTAEPLSPDQPEPAAGLVEADPDEGPAGAVIVDETPEDSEPPVAVPQTGAAGEVSDAVDAEVVPPEVIEAQEETEEETVEPPAVLESLEDTPAVDESADEAPATAEIEIEDAEPAGATAEEEQHAAVEGEADAHGAGHVTDVAFPFEGPFGRYDQFQLQRGLQVYTEVCAACHGLRQVPLRTLSDEGGPGLPEDQVRAYAAEMFIFDAELDEERPRVPTDHFPTVSGEGMGPDLSLMAKARAGFHGPYGTGVSQLFRGIGGPEYIYSMLVGFTGEEQEQAGAVLYENEAFPGGWISMPDVLFEDLVTYADGTAATKEQMAMDVSAFLMWSAEPHMMNRKKIGFVSVIFLIALTALLYLTNKRLWRPVKYGPRD